MRLSCWKRARRNVAPGPSDLQIRIDELRSQRPLDDHDVDLGAVGDTDKRKVIVAGLLGVDRGLVRIRHQRAGDVVVAALEGGSVDLTAVENNGAGKVPVRAVALDADDADLVAVADKRQNAAVGTALAVPD